MALAVAWAAGIVAAGGGGGFLPAAAAFAASGLWPPARRPPLSTRGAASAGLRPWRAHLCVALLLGGAFALGMGLAAAEARRAPGRRALAAWEAAGFDPHRSPIRLAGWIEDLEPSGSDRLALQCVVEAAAFPPGRALLRLTPPLRVRLTVPGSGSQSSWSPGVRFETIA